MRIPDERLIFRMLQYLSRHGCQQSPEGQFDLEMLRNWEREAHGTMQGECCAYARRMGRDEAALLAISWQWAPPSLVNALIGPSLVSNDLMISLPIKLPDWIEISETWWSIPRPRSRPVISHDRLTTCAKYLKIFTWYEEHNLPQEGRLLIAD